MANLLKSRAYKKLKRISRKYCDEYSSLCAIPSDKLTAEQRIRKEELLDILFPNHGKLYGVGAGIDVMIGMVELGDNCYINANVKFNPDVHVKTGDYFLCAPNVTFGSENDFDSVKSIEIGDDVWICADVQIQENVKIGSRSVIGLGSLVKSSSNFEGDRIYSGTPAKPVAFIENRGAATFKREHTEPTNDYEKDFVSHLRKIGFDGDFSQLLYMLRGEKYNSLDELTLRVNDYTHALCAEYCIADGRKRAELQKKLFPFQGQGCEIGSNVFLDCVGSVRLGNNVKIGNNVTLMGNIEIGDGCVIDNDVSLVAIGHEVYHENRHIGVDGSMINTGGCIVVKPGTHIKSGCKIGKGIIE